MMQLTLSVTELVNPAQIYTYAIFVCLFSLHTVKPLLLEYGLMLAADMKLLRTMVQPTFLSIWLLKELKRERNVSLKLRLKTWAVT